LGDGRIFQKVRYATFADQTPPFRRNVGGFASPPLGSGHHHLGLPEPEPKSDAKRPSKQDAVIAMLRRPEGATVDEVASAAGWQRHTVRGVFSGTLKKKLGLTLASAKEERGRVYRIAEPASV
jgi:hypothetical protein